MANFEKYERDGSIAVLYSPGYGKGWSTWNAFGDEVIFDRDIVEKVLAEDRSGVLDVIKRKYPGAYIAGVEDNSLAVCWVKKGTRFLIQEDDGCETVIIPDDLPYVA